VQGGEANFLTSLVSQHYKASGMQVFLIFSIFSCVVFFAGGLMPNTMEPPPDMMQGPSPSMSPQGMGMPQQQQQPPTISAPPVEAGQVGNAALGLIQGDDTTQETL
jgi:hypothetical protein